MDSLLSCGAISTVFFCLALHLEETVADVWISSSNAWGFASSSQLNDLKITEWASLTHRLSSVRFHSSPDSWIWSLDSSMLLLSFSWLTWCVGAWSTLFCFYYVIWKDFYPKKIKVFLWEFSSEAINTVKCVQCQMPYMYLSSSWGLICFHHFESPAHLFIHCPFASKFWTFFF